MKKGKAMIKITDKTGKFLVSTFCKSEQEAYYDIFDIVGDDLAETGIPLAIEMSSWADIATVGEVYDTPKCRVEIVEDV